MPERYSKQHLLSYQFKYHSYTTAIKNGPEKKTRKYEILEEDLSNFAVLSRYDVPDEPTELQNPREQKFSFILNFYRKKQYLILTYPTSAISIWDTNTGGKLHVLAKLNYLGSKLNKVLHAEKETRSNICLFNFGNFRR